MGVVDVGLEEAFCPIVLEMDGNVMRGWMAEEGVGGVASCALARVLRVVGESVSTRCREGRREGGSEGAGEVCSDNFGRL